MDMSGIGEEEVLVATLQMDLLGLKRGFSYTTGGYALLCKRYRGERRSKITRSRYMRLIEA